jgi:hypothetical protein
VYEASHEGYFGLVDIGARYDGPLTTVLNRDWRWMNDPAVRAGAVVALGGDIKEYRNGRCIKHSLRSIRNILRHAAR